MTFVLRNGWKVGLGFVLLAVALTARSAEPIHTHPRALATSVVPTTVPCGNLQLDAGSSDTATWTATSSPYGTGSPFILPANDPNLPTNDPTHPNCLKPDPVVVGNFLPDDIQLAQGTKLVIDGSQGPVRIFSHGTGIIVAGGEIRTINTTGTNFVSFDAEPDVASWDGITIHGPAPAHQGDASFSYVTIQHALTAITIDSGATASPDSPNYGLTVSNSGIGPSYFDGIDAKNTPILVTGLSDGKFGTLNNIGSQGINVSFDSAPLLHDAALKVTGMTFGSSVPFDETACPPAPQSCVVTGSIGNNAIVATLVTGQVQPVVIDSDRFFRAGSFGIDLENANHPQITNNNFDCNGSGSPKPVVTCVANGTLPKFSAIYLNNVTAELLPDTAAGVLATTGVTDNVGQQNGLDALVLSGKVTKDLVWKTPTNDQNPPTVDQPHALGYMVANLAGNGGLEILGKTLTVNDGDVVKVKGGAITLTGGTLDAHTGGLKSFTSMRDNGVGIQACPSVFVQSCPLPVPSNEWIGIDLSGASATIKNANILFTTNAVDVSGAPTLISGPDTGSYGLILTNSRVGPTFSDSVASAGVPMYIGSNKFCAINPLATDPNYGHCIGSGPRNHGINASYSGNPAAAGGLKILGNDFQGSGDSAVLATNLSGRAVDVELNTVENAGTFGIELDGADNLTLKTNTVTGSGVGNTLAPTTYPAIYLNGVTQADFNLQISGNKGWANGLDAIAFHGATKNDLTWRTPANTAPSALPIPLLGYVLDNSLTVNGALTLVTSDLAEVLQGSVTVKGGGLTMTGAVMTSLKQGALNLPTCGSVFVSKVSNACPIPAPGDWNGVVLDPDKANALTGSEIRYATTGITMDKPAAPTPTNLVLSTTSIRNMTGDGITTKSPLSVTKGAFTNLMGHGIAVDLSAAGTGAALTIDQAAISGTGQEGLLAIGLTGQVVSITNNTVDHAGAYGINLVATDNLTLTGNTVTNSAKTYPAIYLNGFKGQFANVHDNKGARNGLDALAFHGTVTDDLVWQTARPTGDPTKLLGYLLDGGLTMKAGHTLTVNAGDIVKVGNGGALNLQGVSLKADDTSSSSQKIFTSLADNTVGVAACPSALLLGCAAVSNTDWGGIVLGGTGANGTLVNGAIRNATTGITISSGKTSTFASSTFGLVVSHSIIGPTAGDGINSTLTPVSVTDSTISNVSGHGISADLANPSTNTTALRLSGNRFMSTGAEAILGQALVGRPVLITDNNIQGAATFGIRLTNADQLVLRNNNISGSGGGPAPSNLANRYPAIYLNAVSADFVRNVRGNVGSGNGLDAIVMDGSVTGDLSWRTPSDAGTTHPLGYLLDGGLTLQGTLTVHAGDVVKALGGPITINGGFLDASDLNTARKVFTSLRDNSDAARAAAVSCPSVFVSFCPPSAVAGDWGGLAVTANGTKQGSAKIINADIDYAGTGISIDSGPFAVGDPAEPSNFRVTVSGGTIIANASKDGINSLDTPFSIDHSTIQTVGAHGIIASFFSPANCSVAPPTCIRMNITNVHITGSGKDGIIANGLAGQPTVVSENTVLNAATYGIDLVGADQLTLVHNDVETSPPSSGVTLRYPAIYLSAVKADFESSPGSGLIVQGNHGTGNGLDAIVFHGEATKSLTWITATSPGVDTPFGYLIDGPLTVDGTLTTKSGDIVKVLNGGITINGALNSVSTIFTSLKDNPGMAACRSVFVPADCPTPPTTLAAPGDWSGINVNGAGGSLTSGIILYANTGVTAAAGVALECSSIQHNTIGVSLAAGGSITQSDVFNNTTFDLVAPAGATADSNWWGSPTGGNFGTPSAAADATNKLKSQEPSLDASDGGSVVLADNNTNSSNQKFGTGTLTVTLNFSREMNKSIQPTVTFTTDSNAVTGDWINDPVVKDWSGTFALSHTNAPITTNGAKTVQVSGARSCVPEFPMGSNSNLMKQPSSAPTFTADLTQLPAPINLAATLPGAFSGTLNGTVDPLGWQTTARFEWSDGTTTNQLPLVNPSVGNGVGAQPVSARILSGLLPLHSYSFHVVAVNGNGSATASPDLTLTTTGVPFKLKITDPPPSVAGSGIDETIAAVDSNGNVVADYTGSVVVLSTDAQATWQIRGASPSSAAAFPANLNYVAADFGSQILTVTFKTSGAQSLSASDSAHGLTGSGGGVNVTAAPTSQFAFSGLTNPSTVGVATLFTLTAEDAYGNTTPTYVGTVQFTSSDLKAVLPSDIKFGALENGVHAGAAATFKTAGTQTVSANDVGTPTIMGTSSGVVVNAAPTSTILTANVNPSTYGSTVTFTATVQSSAIGGSDPSGEGSVTFKDAGTPLISCSGVVLSANAATCITASLGAASQAMTAEYSGTANFLASTSAGLSQVVNPAALTVTASPASKAYGDTNPSFGVGYSGFVLGESPTVLGGTLGFATTATKSSPAGSYSVTPNGLTSTNYAITFVAGTLTINPAGSTTSLGSSLNPSIYGQTVSWTAMLHTTVAGGIDPNGEGTVTFNDGVTVLCNAVAVTGNVASCSRNDLSAGTPSITATYNPSPNFTTSSSSALSQVVNPAGSTTSLGSSLNPSIYGQTVSWTAMLHTTVAGGIDPNGEGTVTFNDGVTVLCNAVAVTGNVASCSRNDLSAGTPSITATYNPSPNFTTSSSSALSQVVNPAGSTTSLGSSLNPSIYGQIVSWTAMLHTTVAGGIDPNGEGTVTFNDGVTVLCNAVAVTGNTASCSRNDLSAATHSVTATYNPSPNFTTSGSSALSQVVNPAGSTTSLGSSLNPSIYGQTVSWTATLHTTVAGGIDPNGEGTVTFNDGLTALCSTVAVTGNAASCSRSDLTVGTHPITATYTPSPNFSASTSSLVNQVVNATVPSPPTGVSVQPANGQVTVSWTAPLDTGGSPLTSYTVTTNPGNLSNSTADATTTSLTVTGLVNGTSYSFTVVARNVVGASAPTPPVTATPRTVPGTPTGVGAVPGNGSVVLTWTSPFDNGGSPITSYTVTTNPGNLINSTADGITTNLTVSGLANGTLYSFTVVANNAAGSSAATAPLTATPRTVPGAPTAVSAVPGNGSVSLSWTAPVDSGGGPITSYTVTTNPGTLSNNTPNGTTTNLTVSGLSNGHTYTFGVVANNAAGPSAATAPVTATPRTVPGPPTGVSAVPGNASFAVSWTVPLDTGGSPLTSYTVTTNPGNLSSSTADASTTNLTVSGLVNGTTYTFTVVANNVAGSSAPSAASTVTAGAPTAPTGVVATPGTGSASVSWTDPADNGSAIVSYTVTPFEGAVAGTPVTVLGPSVTTASVSGLLTGHTYTFQVVATNGSGTGPASTSSPVTIS